MSKQQRITIENNIKQDTISKKYYVTFYFGKDQAGKAIRKTKSYPNLESARLALKDHELHMLKGDTIAPNKLTLNEAVEKHLEILSLKSEASTIYGYRGIARHIESHKIGGRPVQDIKPTEIQQYLSYIQNEKNLSSNTALKHHNLLSSVFNLLEQQEQINRNPAKRVVAPKKEKHSPEYLTIAEAQSILEAVKGDRLETAFALGLYTGMRRGEICGLKWDCIDFDKNIIHIRVNRLNVGSEIVVKPPKSDSSDRSINIVPELKEILLSELQKQLEYKKKLGKLYQDNNYVICFENGEEIRPNYLSEAFKRWFERKENEKLHRVTPHEFRHSFVAISIAAGIPLYEISQALGHNDIGITSRIYAHLLDNTHKNTTEGMAALLRK